MVPGSGALSNCCGGNLAGLGDENKAFSISLEDGLETQGFGEVFTVLAEWNDYLENHVPEAAHLLHADEGVQL